VLAGLIALGVVVQAMVIAFGFFTVGHDVEENGKVLSKSSFDDGYSPLGLTLHGIIGFPVIPVLAIALFIVAFFAKGVPQGVKWAGFVLLAVVLQVTFAFLAFVVPAFGLLHGLNAFVVLGTAAMAARRAATVSAAGASTRETAAV
jgi:hypothetical protein